MAPPKGWKPRPERNAKISAAHKGKSHRPHSVDTKAKMSVAKKGKPGRRLRAEEKVNLRALNLGKKHSPETREKQSAAKRGKPGPWLGISRGPQSAEWRANIAAGNKGKPAYYPKQRFYYKNVPFRSSWEMFVAKAFDAKGIRWEWESVQFDLGNGHTYRPDFHLIEFDCYWEVKGYLGPKSKETIRLFREQYPEIPLIVATSKVLALLDPAFTEQYKVNPEPSAQLVLPFEGE
jgi:hypothetical protein